MVTGFRDSLEGKGMIACLGRWGVLGVVLVVLGCQDWGSSTVYVYEPRRPPTPSYYDHDQNHRYSNYYYGYTWRDSVGE
jgi:hypothetical protein